MQNPDGQLPEPNAADRDRLSVQQRVLAVLLGCASACLVVSVLARCEPQHVTELFGGAGGKEQLAECGTSSVTGVDVAMSANMVAGIRVVCGDKTLPPLGVMAGPVTPLRCPQGWAAVGIWGAVASFVDAFSLSCAPVASFQGPIQHLQLAGGQGGWGFHARCQSGPLTGLRARTGMVVDAVGMTCKSL